MALVGFSCKHTPEPQHSGKLVPEPRPDLHLCGDIVNPSTTHKYLGVVFDQELHWREQAECITGTAAKWMLCFHCLTKLSFGIQSRFMWQLYHAIVIPMFTYAGDMWHAPITCAMQGTKASGSVGVTKWLESIQCIAVTAITGALRTTATDVMEAHANIPPVKLLMHKVCHRAAIRLATLPESHPLHKPVLTCTLTGEVASFTYPRAAPDIRDQAS